MNAAYKHFRTPNKWTRVKGININHSVNPCSIYIAWYTNFCSSLLHAWHIFG